MKRNIILILIFVLNILTIIKANAAIDGVTGTSFNFTAKEGYISTPDGNSIYMWGYALNGGMMQYPGPTLILNQGDTITITLTNELTVPVSITFPGQEGVVATGGVPGVITREAPPQGSVTYSFTASRPGTYIYHSGTNPDLQVEMGLFGAIIIRPTGYDEMNNRIAYEHQDSIYDYEYLFLLSEIDPRYHQLAEVGKLDEIDTTTFFPVYWFINGRAAPDTMLPGNAPYLPTQPYNCMPVARPSERVLMRMIGAGRDAHPFHTHGNHHRIIARDGRLLSSDLQNGINLIETHFTTTVVPGQTVDAIFTWTGEKLGWDVYGHVNTVNSQRTGQDCVDDGVPLEQGEYLNDHCKPFPVVIPSQEVLTFGQFYSGSPFLGALGALPPGEGGFNPNGGYFFMWHSHNEKEITNFDIFPGGMLTMMLIEAPWVPVMP